MEWTESSSHSTNTVLSIFSGCWSLGCTSHPERMLVRHSVSGSTPVHDLDLNFFYLFEIGSRVARLALNLLHNQEWPWMSDPPGCISQIPRLQSVHHFTWFMECWELNSRLCVCSAYTLPIESPPCLTIRLSKQPSNAKLWTSLWEAMRHEVKFFELVRRLGKRRPE